MFLGYLKLVGKEEKKKRGKAERWPSGREFLTEVEIARGNLEAEEGNEGEKTG